MNNNTIKSTNHTVILIILDGWGYDLKQQYNAIAQANIPQWNFWWEHAPKTLLACSGEAVGLPEGQMGNSEVGHMHIGAGRIIDQDYTRISRAIEDKTSDQSFFQHKVLLNVIHDTLQQNKAIHILGLLSPGGVHSHEDHIFALIQCIYEQGIRNKVYLHLFLDGRDTPPRSAKASLEKLDTVLAQYPCAEIKSIIGRYYAMDRDSRWDRVESAYDLLTLGEAKFQASSALEALENAYERDENDEFVQATCIGKPVSMTDGDAIIFMNFRADRARQLSRTFICPDFDKDPSKTFLRKNKPKLGKFVTLTHYAKNIPSIELFPPMQLKHTLGECISEAGLKQLRVAETEKYAHVTFFFNGGAEKPFLNEERVLIPSPRVATYDLQPDMSANAIKDCIVNDLVNHHHDVIIANFANADMVGHTGSMEAAIRAVECLDHCLKEIADAAKKVSAEILITADHGNAECMFDESTGQKHTAHTSDPVPFLYIGKPNMHIAEQFQSANPKMLRMGSLIDIAPTVLYLLGLPIPPEMQGQSLVKEIEN